jgi:hypothetical protein
MKPKGITTFSRGDKKKYSSTTPVAMPCPSPKEMLGFH